VSKLTNFLVVFDDLHASHTCIVFSRHVFNSVIVGKPVQETKHPTLLILAKDHALIDKGETRAFYVVFENHNTMLRFLDFVFAYYKEKNGAAEAQLREDATSTNDSSLDGNQSDGGSSNEDVNESFASVDTELSLLEESQNLFHMNNLLRKQSPAKAIGSPI